MKRLMLLFIVFLLPLVSAELIFQQNKDVNITIPCAFNNTQCSSSANCNYSVFDPEYNDVSTNQSVTVNSESFFVIHLNYSNTSAIGTYVLNMFCYDQGVGDTASIEFSITPSGDKLSTSQGIIYVIAIAVILFLFLLSLYGAINIPFVNRKNPEGVVIGINELKYVKASLWFISYLLLIWISALSLGLTRNFLILEAGGKFFTMVYWVLLSLLWPIMVVSVFLIVVFLLTDGKINKAVKRGLPLR